MRLHWGRPQSSFGPTALSIGNFDGLHLGHQALIQHLQQEALQLKISTAIIIFEPQPQEWFKPETAPARLTPLRSKIELFQKLGVDHLIVMRFNRSLSELSPADFVEQRLIPEVQPQLILVGADFQFGHQRQGTLSTLKRLGAQWSFETITFPEATHAGLRISSTAIRQALQRGDLIQAQQMLGRPFSLSGRVVRGQNLGHTLGYPTANIRIHHQPLALAGIFIVTVHGPRGKPLPAVASLGYRPTVSQDNIPWLEVHVLDFNDSLYDQRIEVHFHHKIRDEQRFATLGELIQEIHQDVQITRTYFKQLLA